MTTPNGEGPKELADMPHLSDVQATDALLDRLAARTPTTDDLDDPIVADLVLLTEFADASPVPPPGIDRLIEVLGGRPLYMFDRSSVAPTEADEPIQLDADRPAARMVDLRAPAAATEDDQDDELAGVAARATGSEHGSPADALGLIRSMRAARRPSTSTGWQGVIQQAALPAASVVALLALGGGVSAVVTGDPMSPVYGITRVASALPGIDNPSEKKLKSAKKDVRLAAAAADSNQTFKAQQLLNRAQSKVADVPQERQQELVQAIQTLSIQVSAAAAASPSPTITPTPDPTASTPVETPTPSDAPVTDPPTTTPDDTTTTPADTSTVSPSAGSDAPAGDTGPDAGSAGG